MELTPTARTKIRRVPQRAAYDRETVDAILDEALVCHLSFVHDGHPFCIPTIHARVVAARHARRGKRLRSTRPVLRSNLTQGSDPFRRVWGVPTPLKGSDPFGRVG